MKKATILVCGLGSIGVITSILYGNWSAAMWALLVVELAADFGDQVKR